MEFERFASSTRKVSVGDVFAALPNDGNGFIFGQVLADGVRLAGADLLLIAFFAGRSTEAVVDCERVQKAHIVGVPIITNRTAWRDGRFKRLQNCPLPARRIGIRRELHGDVLALDGHSARAEDFDILAPDLLSPYGAIARKLAHLGV